MKVDVKDYVLKELLKGIIHKIEEKTSALPVNQMSNQEKLEAAKKCLAKKTKYPSIRNNYNGLTVNGYLNTDETSGEGFLNSIARLGEKSRIYRYSSW